MERLSNEKYLSKILDEGQMELLKKVVTLDFSLESLETLKSLSFQFVDAEKQNLKEKTEALQEGQRELRRLRTAVSGQEDLKDRLKIVD